MNLNVCTVCGKPIVGFFTEVKKNNSEPETVCLDCAKGITLWNLAMAGYAPIYPDVVAEIPMDDKAKLNAKYGMAAKAKEFDYNDTDSSCLRAMDNVREPVNGYKQDAEVMTWDDYCNKYADNPDALDYFVSRQS